MMMMIMTITFKHSNN